MTTEQIIGLAEPALLYFHRKAFERALQEDFLLHLNEAMTPPGQAVGELTTSVMFVDLSGFTRLAEVMGDEAAARVIERFSALVRETLARHTGKTVKQIGDAFMLVFTDPSDAITYGADLMDALIAEPHFPAVRIGAHYGALLYREGDYIGTTVNVAARVANIAERNEFLITDALHRAASPPEPIEVRDVGTRALRGISGEVRVYAVERARAAERRRIFDPVCHMALTRESAAVTATWNGTDYFFCSADCAERFFADPEQVLTTDSSRA